MGEDGTVHLFVARWPCELKVDPGWRSHSEIAHYVGETPEGPFKFSDVAITGTGKDTWDQRHVLEGAANSGFWPVEIGVEGRYQFDVRRWPKEIDHPINASLPAEGMSDIFLNSKPVRVGEGKSIPALKVRLRVGDRQVEKEIAQEDVSALFELDLQPGPNIVRAWLIDANGNQQGAYYVYVSLIN